MIYLRFLRLLLFLTLQIGSDLHAVPACFWAAPAPCAIFAIVVKVKHTRRIFAFFHQFQVMGG